VEGEAPADCALAETSKAENKPKTTTTAENIGKDIGSPVMHSKNATRAFDGMTNTKVAIVQL
jgi:hypothetical protein